jgi:hypothetical protein
MRRLTLACGCCTAVLVACTSSGKPSAADTTATSATPPAAATPAPPPPLALSALAGKWTLKVMNPAGDSTILTETINATGTDTGWTIVRGGGKRPPDKVRVSVSGDSLMTDVGPTASMLRKGVNVATHSVLRMQDGNLVGMGTAHYLGTKTADSVRQFKLEATRAP